MPKSFDHYGPSILTGRLSKMRRAFQFEYDIMSRHSVIMPALPETLPEYKALDREEKLLKNAERSLRTCKNTRDFRYRSVLNFAIEINNPNGNSTTWTPHLARAFEGIARTEHEYEGYLEKVVKWHEKRVEDARAAFVKAKKESWDKAREEWVKNQMRGQEP